MDTNVSTVAEFGKLAELSYLDYEQDILIKGTTFSEFNKDGTTYFLDATYKVIDYTDVSNQGLNAVLLQNEDTKEFVIAFRGTNEKVADITEDAIIGLKNYSFQFEAAKDWIEELKVKHAGIGFSTDNNTLKLTGHSLGGILTQAVGATYINRVRLD